jgi:hypothetical protein
VSIIELAFYLAISAIVFIAGIQADIAHKREQLFATEAQNESTIASGIATWASNNYTTLLAEYTSSGSSTLTPPTLGELYTSGALTTPHSSTPFWGGTYQITLSMVPTGCSETEGNCSVAYVLYPSLPLKEAGKVDVAGAGAIALAGASAGAGGSQFGYSSSTNPSTIFGVNGQWNAVNPLGNQPATLMVTNGPGSIGNSLYIRRDGSLTWTGNQDVNGVDLDKVGNLYATGTVQAQTITSENSGGTQATTMTTDAGGNTSLAQNGALNVTSTSTGTFAPVNAGAITSSSTIQAAAIANPGGTCPTNGQAATNADGSGQWYTCLNRAWTPIGGHWVLATQYAVTDSADIPAPSCSAGAAYKLTIATENLQVDTTAIVNWQTTGTGPWTVEAIDGGGAAISAGGIASVYCVY